MNSLINNDILGLDIGHTSIKTVVFRKNFGRSPSFLCRGTRYPTGLEVNDSTHEFREFLRRFLHRHHLINCRAIASIPGEWVFSRVLTFPFSNPQKISKIIPLEMESFLPLDIEQLVIDHQILTSTSKQTRVLAIAVPKEKLEQRIDLLTKVGLDVRAIEVQSLAPFNAYRWIYPHLPKEGTLLLDMGHSSTSLCFLGPQGIFGIRTILFGVKDLPEGILQQSQTPGRQLDGKQDQISDGIGMKKDSSEITLNALPNSALDAFTQSLRVTVHALENQTGVPVVQTYLFGGGAKVEGLAAYLASQATLPNLQVFSERVSKAGRLISPIFLPAVGLSVKVALGSRGSSIDFSLKMAQAETERQDWQKTWMKIAVGAGVLAILGLANIFATHHFKESRYEGLKRHLRSEFQEVFPHTPNIVNEIQQTQSAIVQDQRMLNFFRGNHTTVLQILADLSQRLDQEDETKVHEVVIDGGTITLQATTRSFEAIERIKREVSQVSWVQDLQVMDAQAGIISNRINFSLNIKVGTA